jgi:hypothetical protein
VRRQTSLANPGDEPLTTGSAPARSPASIGVVGALGAGTTEAILHHDRVLLTGATARLTMRIAVPLARYRGVAVRVRGEAGVERVEVVLAHPDRDLDVVLYAADHGDDVVAEWQSWSGRLNLPLLIEDPSGARCEPFDRLGAVKVERSRPRRRHGLLSGRRPRFLVRRKAARLPTEVDVHRDEREIIART